MLSSRLYSPAILRFRAFTAAADTVTPSANCSALGVAQASGGHTATVFYVGGNTTLWTWQEGAQNWTQIVPAPPVQNKSDGAAMAVRFFVDPYRPNQIYILDPPNVKRSDDGGQTWHSDTNLEIQLTWNYQIAVGSNDNVGGLNDFFDLVLTDMKFDPANPGIRFAVGEGGAFLTFDGVNWTRLLHSGAMPGRPGSCYYDWITDPYDPALYVSLAGRGIVKITDMQLSVIF
jgi:hypothetical protein